MPTPNPTSAPAPQEQLVILDKAEQLLRKYGVCRYCDGTGLFPVGFEQHGDNDPVEVLGTCEYCGGEKLEAEVAAWLREKAQ